MSLSILILKYDGVLVCSTIKSFQENLLFKKCGYKSDSHFDRVYEWSDEQLSYTVVLFGKTVGKIKNAYPFLDTNIILYGNALLVAYEHGRPVPLTLDMWNMMHRSNLESADSKQGSATRPESIGKMTDPDVADDTTMELSEEEYFV